MAQAGILGNLECYQDDQHAWALDLGGLSSRYALLSNISIADEIRNINQQRRVLVRHMNYLLRNNRIRSTTPEFVPGVAADLMQVYSDLLLHMQKDSTPTLLAFFLIGAAVCFMKDMKAIGPRSEHALITLALERLETVNVCCGKIRIDPQGLLERFRVNDISATGIRLLLIELHKPLVILLVSTDPINEARLSQQEEFRQLDQALQRSSNTNAFKVEFLMNCRPEDLAAGIRQHKPTILHFSGHGSNGGPWFVGRNGKKVVIEPARLARLLKMACSEGLKGVFMNACNTERYADCICDAVGEVVAMEGPIGDQEAISFAASFYRCLGDGCSFEKSFRWALAEAGLVESAGPLKPCLIKAQRRHVIPGSQPSVIPCSDTDNRNSRSVVHRHAGSSPGGNLRPGHGGNKGDFPRAHQTPAPTNTFSLNILRASTTRRQRSSR